MQIDVVGAGMAGLLAAAMLRRNCGAVCEAAPKLPNNHSAVLRFRTSIVGDTLNIPFKAVTAIKAIVPWRNPIADALAYAQKTTGTATLRSILTASGTPETRYIAPPDLVRRMAGLVEAPIRYGVPYSSWTDLHRPIISTIPMPSLMDILEYPRPVEFKYRQGTNVIAQLENVDAYCSLYIPDPDFPAARISITMNEMVAECYGEWSPYNPQEFVKQCAEMLGLRQARIKSVTVKQQQYAKILPIDERERRRFILWATENYGIYSLGRYATWRPGLLLDDVVNDVRVIQQLISHSSEVYPHKLKG